MPTQFTLPPDSRAVGQGNPPGDMNAVVDALTASGVVYNVLNTAYAGGADPTNTADSTAAFQAAITAATAVRGEVVIPPGSYNLNTGGLQITGPVKIRGLGVSGNIAGGTFTPAVVLNCNGNGGSTALFTFPWQGVLWSGVEFGHFGVSYTGTGTVFSGLNFKGGWFHDLLITLTASASMAFSSSGNVSVLNNDFDRVAVVTTNATRSNPMINLSSTGSGSISNNTFWKCIFTNQGKDNTQPMVYIDCAGGGNAYHYMECFRDCWFEMPFGGAVKSLSGMALVIDGCTVWDIFSGQGATVGKSCYYIGAFPSTGPGSQQTRITGCSRNQNGPDGASTWDVECEASTAGTIIQGCSVKPDTASTATNFYIQLNGHPDAQVIGCTSPRGAAVNGNSTTVISNPAFSTSVLGSIGAVSNALDVTSLAGFPPGAMSLIAYNFDLALAPATFNALTSQTLYLVRVDLRRAATITNVIIYVGTAGATLTAGQNLCGLYNSAGTLLSATADQSSGGSNWTTTGLKTIPLTASQPVQAGLYWVGILSNGTTPIAPARANNSSGTLINAGIGVAANARWARNGTAVTSLAAITPSANDTTWNLSVWAGLS